MKCLIVEDNPAMRRLIRRFVADLVPDFVECGDGIEAITAYAACNPDWVLMDIELPGQNGLSATRQIKARWPEARILMFTSYDAPELRREAQQAGACGYVLKEHPGQLRHWLQGVSDC